MKDKRSRPGRLRRVLSRKKGFTLVELLVSLLLTSVVIVASGSILLMSMRIIGINTGVNTRHIYTQSVLELVAGRLRFAREVKILETASQSELLDSYFEVENGRLLYTGDRYTQGVELYDRPPGGMNVRLLAKTEAGSGVVTLTVLLVDKDGDVGYESQPYAVRVSNMVLKGNAFAVTAEIADPVITYK